MSLQNVSVVHGPSSSTSVFIDPVLGKTAQFMAKNAVVKFKSAKADMVNIAVRINQSVPVGSPECDPCGNDTVVSNAELRLNIIKGDLAAITSFRAEVNTLFDQALASYQLAFGLVPPASATFVSE